MSGREESQRGVMRALGSGLASAAVALRTLELARADTTSIALPRKENILEREEFAKGIINVQSDDFWYPPYLLGIWDTNLTFAGAKFTKKIPLDTLADGDTLPGFAPYSVFFAPKVGYSVANVPRRFVSVDSHPREDHSFNIRALVRAFMGDAGAEVTQAAYAYQKAPTWLSSPANRWTIKYADNSGSGIVEIETLKRNITAFAGSVETSEFIKQTHRRSGNSSAQQPSVSDSYYCLNWQLFVPASSRDEFVTAADLARTNLIIGRLNILSYLRPSSDLYLQLPSRPAGVFSYNVTMTRRGGDRSAEVQAATYPFVWRADGPVELDQYFKY